MDHVRVVIEQGRESYDVISALLSELRSRIMAERQAFLTALTELFNVQNRIIEGQQATITELQEEVVRRGLPDDQVPQANLDQELSLVQEQQQRLEQMMATEPIEGTSPEGEQVVIQPEPDAATGGGTAPPAEGDEATAGAPSDTNVQPPPTNPGAPPTETEGGAVGNQGGGTAPEPMT